MEWKFDQERNAAAITTRQVIHDNLPVLVVNHYEDDHSWSFVCGTTGLSEDLMVVGMCEIVDRDPSLHDIADLAPGWIAIRKSPDDDWQRGKDQEVYE